MPKLIAQGIDKQAFWKGFLRGVETTPASAVELTGGSGLSHPVVSLGLDEVRRRMVVVSGEPDGRSAALAQIDLQNAYPDYRVLLARPIPVNLGLIARTLAQLLGKDSIEAADLNKLPKSSGHDNPTLQQGMSAFAERGVAPAFRGLSYAALDLVGAWQDVIAQLAHLEFDSRPAAEMPVGSSEFPTIRLGQLMAFEPSSTDRRLGVCPVPLYELDEGAVETVRNGKIEEIQRILKVHDLFQYFFPAPDQLALGVIERLGGRRDVVTESVSRAPSLGHPFGQTELVGFHGDLRELVDALRERSLVVDGEVGLELTESGRATRAAVRFKPRESFLAKLARVITLKIDLSLKDLLR